VSEDALSVAAASPAAVARGDLPGWLALFHADAVLEDPVGTRPHHGHAGITRFWRALVEGVSVQMTVHGDFQAPVGGGTVGGGTVGGGTVVVRAVTIATRIAPGAPEFVIPAILEYRVEDARIRALRAHWDLRRAVGWYRSLGLRALPLLARQGLRMLGALGPRAVWAFTWGLCAPRVPTSLAHQLLAAGGDAEAWAAGVEDGPARAALRGATAPRAILATSRTLAFVVDGVGAVIVDVAARRVRRVQIFPEIKTRS
jgi:hypothetical protein